MFGASAGSGGPLLNRRRFLTGAAGLAAVGGLCGSAPQPVVAGRRRPGGRPNIVLLVTDDQPLGTEWATPSIRGTTFTRAYATTPLCGPSRASILTGRYAHNHGVLQNLWPQRLDMRSTLPCLLREQGGYRTAIVGKYLNGWHLRDAPPYFDEYAVMHPPLYEHARWNLNGTIVTQAAYTTSLIRQYAVDFLRRRRGDPRPWFLYVTPYAPHEPFWPESAYADLAVPPWDGNPAVARTGREGKPAYIRGADGTPEHGRRIRAAQLRALRSVDDLFRALWNELAAQDALNDTLVMVVSDNGYCWADHGWVGKNVPYAPSTRIPLTIHWPAGGFGPGRRDDRLVATIDIAPTLLDAAGIPAEADGRSLLRPGDRDDLLLEWWKHGGGQAGHSWASVVGRDFQYIEHYDLRLNDDGRLEGDGAVVHREYYDLRADPHQVRNLLHGAAPDAWRRLGVDRLSARLAPVRSAFR
ncbi:sulfatase family protein [Thermomonospora catenispora]|uniref:sulfatase family protein n=1 Tax=Thermomonospora catenispora TaxID=2493090 RepID=UPI001F500D4C|nr:sulfatase [Thermomonospora catenispora]